MGGKVTEKKKTGRTRIIGLRLTTEEYSAVEKNWKNSTIRRLSEFVRRILFGKAVTTYSRNQSLDDLIAELVQLRKELNAIGVNINQAVHRLHTLDYVPQMISWIEAFEHDRDRLFARVEEIKSRINLISDQWLQ